MLSLGFLKSREQLSPNCQKDDEMVEKESLYLGDWQANSPNIALRLAFLHYESVFSDLTVECEEEEFKVHKLILAMYSPVFEKMFYGSLPHREEKITFQGVSSRAFKWMVDYMYLGVITLRDFDLAIEIYSFAHEKQMNMVVARCSKFLAAKVTIDNALMLLQMSNLYEDEDLKSTATKKIFEKRESVFNSDEICDMPKSVLLNLVSSSKVYCSERATFRSIYNWSKMQLLKRNEDITAATVRNEMKYFLPYINFLMMGSDVFISEVLSTGMLSADEAVNALKRINSKDGVVYSPSEVRVANCFPEETRIMHTLTVIKYPQCNTSFFYNHMQEEPFSDKIIVIRTSENVLISSLKLKAHCFSGSWKIHITNCDDLEIGVSSNDTSPWYFDTLVPVLADKSYIFKIQGNGKRAKHRILDYESCMNGVNFNGVAISCNITIVYFT